MAEQSIEEKIKEALDAIRPQLQADGGDLEFIKYEDTKVYVKLTGACGGCPMATMTLKLGIENSLLQQFPSDVTEVVQAF